MHPKPIENGSSSILTSQSSLPSTSLPSSGECSASSGYYDSTQSSIRVSSSARSSISSIGMSIPQSSRPQAYRVKAVEAKCHAHTYVQIRTFQNIHDMSSAKKSVAKPQEASSNTQMMLDVRPMPTEKSTRLNSRFFSRTTYFENILIDSREPNPSPMITTEDLDYILIHCKMKKYRILCFRILHSLAEYQWQLPENAIALLIEECRKFDVKTLPNVVMALGYAIYYQPHIPFPSVVFPLFDEAIKNIWNEQNRQFLEAIIVLIAAKAKLGCPITQSDFQSIQQALAEENDPVISNLYPPYPLLPNDNEVRSLSRLKTWSKIKGEVKKKGRLSNEELKDIFNYYISENDRINKNKILSVVRHAVLNGQYVLPNESVVTLKEALGEQDFRLRSQALEIAKCLSANQMLSVDLREGFVRARHRERFFALTALHYFIQNGGLSAVLLEIETWCRLISALKENTHHNEPLRSLASYILFQCESTLTHVEMLILDPRFCIWATGICLNAVRRQESLSDHAIRQLTDLVLIYRRQVHSEALTNAIAVFRYMAEQGRPFHEHIFSSVIEIYNDSSSPNGVKEAILLLQGVSIPLYPTVVMREEFLAGILRDLKQRELLEALCFILIQWIDATESPSHRDTFTAILMQIMEWVLSPDLTIKERKALVRLIGKGFQKEVTCSKKSVKEFICFANQCTELSFQYRSIQALLFYLLSQEQISWFQPLVDLALTLSKSEYEEHFLHARAVLSRYMEIVKVDESFISRINPLVQLFAHEKTVSLGVDIFRELVNRKIPLPNKALKMIASAMVNENFDTEADLALLLLAASQNHHREGEHSSFPQKVIKEVIKGLLSPDEVVVDCCVQIMQLNQSSQDHQTIILDKGGIDSLMGVIRREYLAVEMRLQALAILSDLSVHHRVRISLEALDELRGYLESQEVTIKIAILNLLASQMEILSVSPLNIALLRQIERSVLVLAKEGELLKESMRVIFCLGRLEYKLSVKALEWIAEALYSQQDIGISSDVSDLLTRQLSYYPGQLTDRISIILDIQKAAATLRQRPGVINTKIAAIKKLTRMLKQNHRMTSIVFVAMIDVIDQYVTKLAHPSSQKLLRNIIKFCEEFLFQEQFVPPKLLQCLLHLQGDQLTPNSQQRRIQLIARCLQRNNSIDPIAFLLVEERFLSGSEDQNTVLFLDALDVIVKRGYHLREEAVESLWNLLLVGVDEEVSAAADVLISLVQLLLRSSSDLQYPYKERLKSKIEGTSSEKIKEKLQNLHKLLQGSSVVYCQTSRKEKNLYVLLDEMKSSETNAHDAVLIEQIQTGYFERCLASADALYSPQSEVRWLSATSVPFPPIHTWGYEDIKAWSRHIKQWIEGKLTEPFAAVSSSLSLPHVEEAMLPECLAIFRRVCLLLYGYEPRTVQLLALLVLTQRTTPGILGQISTGEGKSLIIAMLSVIKALQGKYVDILTSSPVLASRDAKFFQTFYELFDLKCASNEDNSYQQGLKRCYRKDVEIVYGEACYFQYDELRHSYSGLNTRGERRYDFLILDEVDYALVEGNDTLAMLSSPMPGMQELIPLLICIWLELHHLEELRKGAGSLEQFNPFDLIDCSDQEAVRMVIEAELFAYVERIIEKGVFVPSHLREYVSTQAQNWIHSAWLAFYVYQPKSQYEIKFNRHQGGGDIAPVDFANTGVIQVGTSWGDGLQQFLQMKHGLVVEPITLVTNYSSIYSFIRRYSERIGITGTLGSTYLKGLLRDPEIYGFVCVEIPTFLPTQIVKLEPLLLQNGELWLDAVISGAIREAGLGRVVLVICETIDAAHQIELAIRTSKSSVQLYSYTDDKSGATHFLDKKLDGNTIIVATNLAGRGTDIRLTQEAIRQGGLHVCVTFLPVNSRVELQAFGRTGRRGEPGTVQLVLNRETLTDQLKSSSVEDFERLSQEPQLIEKLRDREEFVELKEIKERKVPGLLLQERLFTAYLELVKEVSSSENMVESEGKRRGVAEQIYYNEICKMKKKALEEHWGKWLKNHLQLEDKQETWRQFEAFKLNVLQNYHRDLYIDNPTYYIQLGNHLLMQSNSYRYVLFKKDLLRLAIRAYDTACSVDRTYCYNALYHKAYVLILLRDKGYKNQAKAALKQMVEALVEGPFKHWQSISLLLREGEQRNGESKIYLSSQLEQQLQAYLLLLQSAQNVIKEIDESMKLIELRFGPPCYSQISENRFTKSEALEFLKSENLPQTSLEVAFNHLKTHVDLVQRSQLRETVNGLPQELPVTLTFHSDKLYSERSREHGLSVLLPVNQRSFQMTEAIERKMHNNQASSSSRFKPMSSFAMTLTRSNKRKRLEGIPVTLTLFQIPAGSILEILSNGDRTEKKLSFLPVQSFGIGPINLSEPLLKLLHERDPTLQISSKTSRDEHSFSVQIAVSEITLELISNEISIIDCQAQLLIEILHCIPPETPLILTIHSLDQKKADQLIKIIPQPITLGFVDLDRRDALDIVDMTSIEHNCATLSVRNISSDQAKVVIPKASRSQEDFTIKHRPINDDLSKICNSLPFLESLRLNGYYLLYDVKEDLPLPWRSMATLLTLGVLQIAGGVTLEILKKGSSGIDGKWLISEGLSDIRKCYQVYSKREFNLMGFILKKGVVTTEALVSSSFNGSQGHSHHRGAFRGRAQFSNASKRLINFSMEIAPQLGASAIKKVIATTFQAGGRIGISYGQKMIKTRVNQPLQQMLSNESHQKALNKLLAIDAFLGNSAEYENIRIQVSNLFISMKSKGSQIAFFDGHALNLFIRLFVKTIRDRFSLVDRFKTLFIKRTVGLGLSELEIDQIFAWLQKESIVNSYGEVDSMKLLAFKRGIAERGDLASKYAIDQYDIDLFLCSPHDEVRRAVLLVCLTYARCMEDDYSLMRKNLIGYISDNFCALFESKLNDVVNVTVNTLNTAAQAMVSVGTDAVSDSMKKQRHFRGRGKARGSIRSERRGHRGRWQESSKMGKQPLALTLVKSSVTVTAQTMLHLYLSQYRKGITFRNEKMRIQLAELAYLNARETVDTFLDLKKEQVKIIQNIIGLIILAHILKGDSSETLSEERQAALDRSVKSAFHRCRKQVAKGEGTVLVEWKEMASDRQSQVHGFLRNLEEAWRLYEATDKKEHHVVRQMLSKVYSPELTARVGDLAIKHQYSELGLLLRENSSTLQGCVQGHLVEQIGNLIQGMITNRQLSKRGHFRLQSMALALTREAMINHASIQGATLSIHQQVQSLTVAAVLQQTEIARQITDNYKDFVEQLFQVVSLEIEDISEAIEGVKTAFDQKRVRLDEISSAQVHFIKGHACDLELLKESSEHAKNFLTQMVRIAKQLAKKSIAELSVFSARTQETWISQEDPSPLEIEGDDVFIPCSWIHEGVQYQRDGSTLGDGACAIHALIGSKYQGEYLWLIDPLKRVDAISVQKNAKNHFLSALEPLIGSDRELEAILLNAMEERIVETVEYSSYISPFDDALAQCQENISTLLLNCYRDYMETFDSVFITTPNEFNRLKSFQVAGKPMEQALTNCYRVNYETMCKLDLMDSRWGEMLRYEESRQRSEERRTAQTKQFVRDHFNLYAEIVRSSDCYLSFEELELAAHLFVPDKKVLVFYRFDEPPHMIHPTASGDPIAIEHSMAYFPEGRHFSRLTRVVS